MSLPHLSNVCHEYHGLVRDFGGPKPPIVVLCGSTRFIDEFNRQRKLLTEAGEIVLSIEVVTTQTPGEDPQHVDPELKRNLDQLHLRKIDLADRVLVLNVATDEHWEGYIGDSTRAEIVYAYRLGKPITWLTPMTAGQFAALLPDELRAQYWRGKVTQYFDEKLGGMATDA